MGTVLAAIATAGEKLTCCHPDAVSPVNVAVASRPRVRPQVADVGADVPRVL
jgi:hypothetical protein